MALATTMITRLPLLAGVAVALALALGTATTATTATTTANVTNLSFVNLRVYYVDPSVMNETTCTILPAAQSSHPLGALAYSSTSPQAVDVANGTKFPTALSFGSPVSGRYSFDCAAMNVTRNYNTGLSRVDPMACGRSGSFLYSYECETVPAHRVVWAVTDEGSCAARTQTNRRISIFYKLSSGGFDGFAEGGVGEKSSFSSQGYVSTPTSCVYFGKNSTSGSFYFLYFDTNSTSCNWDRIIKKITAPAQLRQPGTGGSGAPFPFVEKYIDGCVNDDVAPGTFTSFTLLGVPRTLDTPPPSRAPSSATPSTSSSLWVKGAVAAAVTVASLLAVSS